MAMRVLAGKIDRFLSAALASASRAPPRSRRNGYFSADASGSSCPNPAINPSHSGRLGRMEDSFDFAACWVQGQVLKTSFRRMDVHCERSTVSAPQRRSSSPSVAGLCLPLLTKPKAFGVAAACRDGRRGLCPQLIFVNGHFEDYQRLGDAAIKVVNDFTPLVERISIDEAFADVAGCSHLFGPPAEIARAIRRRVRAERSGSRGAHVFPP
jgi:hypothetical protein